MENRAVALSVRKRFLPPTRRGEEGHFGLPSMAEAELRLRALIALIAVHDHEALARLHDVTATRLFALAEHILRDPGDAEEAVSDAYLQVWRTAAGYRADRSPVSVWLLMICRSRALDMLRAREDAFRFQGPAQLWQEAEVSSADPQDLLAIRRRHSMVQTALSALPPISRQLLALAFFRGYTHQEISISTGIPLGTVKSQIRRGLAALRASSLDFEEIRQ